MKDHRYLFFGAGEAGIGIANLLASAIQIESGCTLEEAYQCSYFVDSKGLITNIRLNDKKFEHHKIPYAHDTAKLLGKDSSKIGTTYIKHHTSRNIMIIINMILQILCLQ